MPLAHHIPALGVVLFGVVVAWLAAGTTPIVAAEQLPTGPNRDLVYGKCRTCHDLQYLVDSKGITSHQWEGILAVMRTYGLELSKDEHSKILNYLTTYMGPNPPPEPAPRQGSGVEKSADGSALFRSQCVSCHQLNGQGQVGEFPPLAENPDLFITQRFPVYVLLNGLRGEIEVNGRKYNGEMPSFSFLSNKEIAALITFIRSAWGNDRLTPSSMPPVTAADVGAVRKERMTPKKVHEYRARHLR